MPLAASEIEARIAAALPGAEINVVDTAGDADHYHVTVVSEKFKGLSRVAQHQLVYNAIGQDLGRALHAMALTTKTPA